MFHVKQTSQKKETYYVTMSIRTVLIILGVLLVLSLGIAVFAYPILPQQVASHWNAQGQVDGYTSRLSGLALLPAMLIGISLLLLFIPQIDPLKANIQLFRAEYNGFIAVFALFMFYLHLITVAINLGLAANMNQLLFPAMGFFVFYVGLLLGKARRNYFIGIRTPWTLSDAKVWDKTNKLAARIFKIIAVASLAALFLGAKAFGAIIAALVLAMIYLVVYSYFEFRKQKLTKH